MSDRCFCNNCLIQNNHPGVDFNSENICAICTGRLTDRLTKNYNYISDNYNTFISDDTKRQYDYMLMLSGGKDSIFMLHKLLKETSKTPLAYTYDHPFESKNAQKNVKKVIDKLEIDHIKSTANSKYKKLMRAIFTSQKDPASAKYNSEKIPCILCSYYIMVNACIFAYKFNIPYVLYCADPMQMVASMSDVRMILRLYTDELGKSFCEEIFGDHYNLFLDENNPSVPQIIFPYVSMINNYNAESIIDELMKAGLYETSPIETSCALYPLLQLYSYMNYDCNFYTLEYASSVRNKVWHRDMALALNERYKNMIFSVSNGEINEKEIREVIAGLHLGAQKSDEYMYQSIINFKQSMDLLGIKFNGKNMEVI